MQAIIETTPSDYQGATEFIGIEHPSENLHYLVGEYEHGSSFTMLELIFDGRVLAVWSYVTADTQPIREVPEFIVNHANAWALLLQDNNDYPALDWIDHTKEV